MRTKIRVILFDADHVIQRAAPFEERLANIFGLDAADAAACATEIYAAEATTLTGDRPVLDAMEPVIEKWGGGKVTPTHFFQMWNDIRIDDVILTLISELRKQGYYCALASNQHAERAGYMIQNFHLDQYFDHCFFSFQLGYAKPNPQFFLAICDQTGWPPADHLFIDDNADNIAGALNIGMHAERYEMPMQGSGIKAMRRLLAGYGISEMPSAS